MKQNQCVKCGHLWTKVTDSCPECGSTTWVVSALPQYDLNGICIIKCGFFSDCRCGDQLGIGP